MIKTEILNRLQAGNDKFVMDRLTPDNQDTERRKAVVGGQDPFAIILSCADSRVVPELIFGTGIGELFVVRVAGNVANMSSIASIEYAVAVVGTQVIVVLGHQSCGAVAAAVQGGDQGKNINHLLSHIKPAITATGDDASINEIAKENVALTVQEMINNSSIISEAVKSGKVEIIPAYYNLDTGRVDFLA